MSMIEAEASQPTPADFQHEGFLYGGLAGFLAGTVPFLRAGLAAEEPMLVMVAADKIAALRDELGADATGLCFADMAEVGANPARIIPTWRTFADGRLGPDATARGIGEPIWTGRRPAELIECQRHEALLNIAFADTRAFRLLCPYDSLALPSDVVAEVWRSHPFVHDGGALVSSSVYGTSPVAARRFDVALPEPTAPTRELVFGDGDLFTLRMLVERIALDAGLPTDRAADTVLAVHELATNSQRHGGGGGTLRMWREGSWLLYEVCDQGVLDDPLAGRRQPAPHQEGGHGLWLVNQLCDLVQVRTFTTGTVVRVHMRVPDHLVVDV